MKNLTCMVIIIFIGVSCFAESILSFDNTNQPGDSLRIPFIEDGFIVSPVGNISITIFPGGNPGPSIGLQPFTSFGEFSIKHENGSLFEFIKFDLRKSNFFTSFQVSGFLEGQLIGSMPIGGTNSIFTTFNNTQIPGPVDQLTFVFSAARFGQQNQVDNIVLRAIPEPHTIFLVLISLLLLFFFKRKDSQILN